MHDSATMQSPADLDTKKRKRDVKALGEIEVDVRAPEPLSKKALRRAKKGKPLNSTEARPDVEALNSPIASEVEDSLPTARSEHSIWIGNLPWTACKADLEDFLTTAGGIEPDTITRVHLPGPTRGTLDTWRQKVKPVNRGFAYVDFSSAANLIAALGLTETLLGGRRVLVKDAKNFDGRPVPTSKSTLGSAEESDGRSGKSPNAKIFVGNLTFDTDKEVLSKHFEKCGAVADVFVATFEDTGKCKGFAWITFEDVESAAKAIRGWVELEQTQEDDPESKDDSSGEDALVEGGKGVKRRRLRKWWVNRLKGRALRMEFAEDKMTRYKKRFTSGRTKGMSTSNAGDSSPPGDVPSTQGLALEAASDGARIEKTITGRREGHGRHVDARKIKPGAALASASRSTLKISAIEGKKIIFD